MSIQILTYEERTILASDVIKLYHHAGWWEEREEEDIEKMLKQDVSVGVWNNQSLVGFARAVSDGIFRAYIEDVVVHCSYQKEGIGKKLVARLVEELSNIDVISLFCEEEYIPFYERNAFRKSKSQFVMHKK